MTLRKRLLLGVLFGGLAVACGGRGDDDGGTGDDDRTRPVPTSKSPTPPQNRIIFTSDGLAGEQRLIRVGGDVLTIRNNDDVAHQLASMDCPYLRTGPIAPGETVELRLPADFVSCRFYDPLYPGAFDWTGRIDSVDPAE